MTKIFSVPFANGEVLFAAPSAREAQAFGAEDVIERAADSFESVLTTIRNMGESFAARMADLQCQTAEASFGVTLTGKGKFIVAEASAAASLTVKLVFKGKG